MISLEIATWAYLLLVVFGSLVTIATVGRTYTRDGFTAAVSTVINIGLILVLLSWLDVV